MPNVVIKITSRIPPEKIGEALGYADEKHKEKVHEEIKVGRGGFLQLRPHDDPRTLLCLKGAGAKGIRMVFSFSEEYVQRLEDRMVHVDRALSHVVHGTMSALSTHLFGFAHEIGYAIGRHDGTDNKHFHLVVCPRSWSNKRVCIVGKISPNGGLITNREMTPRREFMDAAANRISEEIASAEPGGKCGLLSMERLVRRIINLVNLGLIKSEEVRELVNALDVEILNERQGRGRPARAVAVQRRAGRFLAQRGLLVSGSEIPDKPAEKPRRRAFNPFRVKEQLTPHGTAPSTGGGGGRAITWPGLTRPAQEIGRQQVARPAPAQRVEPPARTIAPPAIDHGHHEDGGGMRP